jgi:hypothetical protein
VDSAASGLQFGNSLPSVGIGNADIEGNSAAVTATEPQYQALSQCAADSGLSISSLLRTAGLDRAHRDGKWPVVKETNAA